jgi:hypothetical protein
MDHVFIHTPFIFDGQVVVARIRVIHFFDVKSGQITIFLSILKEEEEKKNTILNIQLAVYCRAKQNKEYFLR